MSYWVVQTFAVENPAERLEEVRARLSLDDDILTLVETGGETHPTVLVLSTSRLRQPDMSSAYSIQPDDETLFGPFMSFVLDPSEYGCVLGLNDTSDGGIGYVYTKRPDGSVAIVDSIGGTTGGFGADIADAFAAEYGFRPFTEAMTSLEYIAHERDDPLVKYRGIGSLEPMLADDEPNVETARLRCPACSERDDISCSRVKWRRVYESMYRCGACDQGFIGFHLHLLPSPTDDCPECGGTFLERDLQYPELGSTAFECDECGFVTFDTLDLPESDLAPAVERDDLVGPDVAAYRAKHGLDSDGADSNDSAGINDGDTESESVVLDSIRRLLRR